MRINIQTKNLELTDSIRDYVNQKIESFSKFITDDSDPVAQIELAKERSDQNAGNELYKAEINLTVLGQQVYLDAKSFDLYAAIDEMKDKALRELRQEKEKGTSAERAGGREAKAMLRGE